MSASESNIHNPHNTHNIKTTTHTHTHSLSNNNKKYARRVAHEGVGPPLHQQRHHPFGDFLPREEGAGMQGREPPADGGGVGVGAQGSLVLLFCGERERCVTITGWKNEKRG